METAESFKEVMDNLPIRQQNSILRFMEMEIEALGYETKVAIAATFALAFGEIYTQNRKIEELTTKLEKLRTAHNACATEKVSQ